MKIYAGAPAAARHYVEADRGRADDYYLTEGTGVARRFTATDGRVAELAPLTGDTYETWVAGRDPETGEPRGQLRGDEHAVRFVEVVVNGPKTWSLAAALHPDIATAYEAAQDRAAEQIVAWLSQHATTRVGPRGGQVQVPVEALEAATVRHYTSRAEDPHWHLHLQMLSRVFAADKWRGLHTVGIRDFIGAINGIGHAAMACGPELNAAFAAKGYTKDGTGEIQQLAEYVGPFSARHAQIARNVGRYEAEWTAAHPGEHPGPALRRAWDARAWADGRPDKVTAQSGVGLAERWRDELSALGYRDPGRPVDLAPTPVGALDRDELVQRALTRLAAGRSAWNAADIRGEAERLIAAAGIVADAAVRIELAEDLTARALQRCLPLLDRDGVPEHIRTWTSQPVLDVEAELTARLAARAVSGTDPALPVEGAAAAGRLDAGQAAAVAALAGDRPLVVVEGAAGAGKTTTLAATRDLLEAQGRRLVVVTPTRKAAKVAAGELGAAAGSAAFLAFQHGWRWNDEGRWIRLTADQDDPATGRTYAGPNEAAQLRPGDLLLVDEAGMLDQDTARALLTIADECQVQVALLGDRHQLSAVGRGGVLDLAIAHADPAAHLTLDAVHRFTRTDQEGRTAPDATYAELTLAMRTGEDPGAVFDALLARGQIQLHPDAAVRQDAIAVAAAEHHRRGDHVAVVVDTREQAAELNNAIRERLVVAGRVDDRTVAVTGAGKRIGAGDRIATRRNDRHLDVANRDSWMVTAVGRRGGLLVTPAVTPTGTAPGSGADGVTPGSRVVRVLPADYVTEHVEFAYASTAYGVQGDTVTSAHVMVGEHTGAASAYVGMTRGRTANTAHLVAADADEAREQWIAVFARDRADLGPAHAAGLAAAEAARYAPSRPLADVLAELHAAWTAEQHCLQRLAYWGPQGNTLREIIALETAHRSELADLQAAREQAAVTAKQAKQQAAASGAAIAAHADRVRDTLLARWDGERPATRAAAKTVLDGPGRLGLRQGAVTRAGEQLTDWADRWRIDVPSLPADPKDLAKVASWFDDRPALWTAFDTSAHRAAEHAHPEHAQLCAAADAARDAHEQARRALAEASRRRGERLDPFGTVAWAPGPAGRLTDLQRDIAATRQELTDARACIATLTAEPALLAQPPDRLTREREAWRTQHSAGPAQRGSTSLRPTAPVPGVPRPEDERLCPSLPRRDTTPGLGR
ncbi:relaxase domain-containing protein [Blastococcus saxobsidens]|uniref:Relaxase domain-containing protein n=1 Tax=Blastococcus saxobsidens TaxID=138336 RepID=A0A6L9W295_9ACTN|nr:MobF family relaxase [Blastococcus saxobsidens]NEK86113.1 relaxase domain-containing protein [Blastococcus saxobsidens]